MRLAVVLCLVVAVSPGCAQPECTNPNYRRAECRVIAENDVARLLLPSGVEVRFQAADATDDATWDATGLLQAVDPGTVRARVAGLGAFAISVRGIEGGPGTLELQLDNVSPEADVRVETGGVILPVPAEAEGGLRRDVMLVLDPAAPVWIRGDTQCPERYRIAVTADIQTNPAQFERIVEALGREAEEADALGEPVRGMMIIGDITESSRDDEFERMLSILATSEVPVAVTPGNHDIYRPFRAHYNQYFGPGNHGFTVCTTRVVLLDSGSGTIARSVEGRLPELLDRGDADHLVLGMHHPPYAGLTAAGWSSERAAGRLLAEAAIARADLIVSGHAHSLHDFAEIPVGDRQLHQIIAGTGGAYQGLGIPRYGYVRLTIDAGGIETCFVEVPPPGFVGPQNDELSARLPYCE
jgi:predicted phosphodiesterase